MHFFWTSLSLLSVLLSGYVAEANPLGRQQSYATAIQRHGSDWSPQTTFYSAGSSAFKNSTERWTTYDAPTYKAAVQPANERDLMQIVRIASQLRIPFLATGARHGYTTTIGELKNGLAIDLSLLNTVAVDNGTGRLTVGPGVKFGDIFEPLFGAGFDIQTGSAPCPSVIGVTLGGGAGRYQGTYGLMIDALVSARLVTAQGEMVEVSKTKNPDLFWAIRGAGANFGIVVSATFQAHPLKDGGDNFNGIYRIPAGREAEYFQLVERLQPLDEKLSSLMLMNYNQSTDQVCTYSLSTSACSAYNDSYAKTQVQVQWVYKGQESNARTALKSIHDFGLLIDNEAMTKWNTLVTGSPGIDIVCAPNKYQNIYSWNMRNFDASSYTDAFRKMSEFFLKNPTARSSNLQFELFSNRAMIAVPEEETSFPWRDSTGQIHLNIILPSDDYETDAITNDFGQKLRADMIPGTGFDNVTVFVSFAHGDEPIERMYGEHNLPRLSALKAKWDPEQIFSFNNGLPLEYP